MTNENSCIKRSSESVYLVYKFYAYKYDVHLIFLNSLAGILMELNDGFRLRNNKIILSYDLPNKISSV